MASLPQHTGRATFLRGASDLILGEDPPAGLGTGSLNRTIDLAGGRGSDGADVHEPASGRTANAEELRAIVQRTFSTVADGLQEVEETVRKALVSDSPQLCEIAHHLLDLGGKRIRPILSLLASRLFGSVRPRRELVEAAAGIELIHMATLLHDDIIDQSTKRRHRETAYITYGLTPTLLAGDFLWVRAFGLCAHLGELVVRRTERACVELTEGELMEGTLSEGRRVSLDQYVEIVSRKTASLFSLSAVVGAHFGGASPADLDRLDRFGRSAGIAFQMIDDILDVVSSDDLLGKAAGTDLRQRTPSLVNVLWLESDPEHAAPFFAGPPTPDDVEAARARIAGSSVIGRAREIARARTDDARRALAELEAAERDPEIESYLVALLDYTLARCL